MFELVVVVKVYRLTVLVSAVVPVAVPSRVPVALLSLNLARGNIVPEVEVFLSQRVKVMVEPLGIVPETFGTPLCVSNSLMRYSPAARFLRFPDWIAKLVESGLAVFSWKRLAVVEASLCR